MSTLTIPGFQSKRFKPLQTLYTNTITPLVFFFFWESTLLVILTARGIITSPCLILCRFNWAKSDQAQTFWHFGSWDLRFLCAGLLAMPDSTWGWLRSRSPATATPPIDASTLPVYRNHKNWQLAAGSFQIKRKKKKKRRSTSLSSHSWLLWTDRSCGGLHFQSELRVKGSTYFFYSSLALDVDFY
jgi:hypothetical protein